MLKQSEKSKILKSTKISFYKQEYKKTIFKRIRKLYKKSTYAYNVYFKEIINTFKKNYYNQKIFIRITPNNVFCTLLKNDKTVLIGSTGKYKIKTSKKKLKFSSKIIIKSFLKEIKKFIKNNKIFINIISPKNLRRLILDLLFKILKNKLLIINILEKKIFNGCRPKKQKRKKRKGIRLLKF